MIMTIDQGLLEARVIPPLITEVKSRELCS